MQECTFFKYGPKMEEKKENCVWAVKTPTHAKIKENQRLVAEDQTISPLCDLLRSDLGFIFSFTWPRNFRMVEFSKILWRYLSCLKLDFFLPMPFRQTM